MHDSGHVVASMTSGAHLDKGIGLLNRRSRIGGVAYGIPRKRWTVLALWPPKNCGLIVDPVIRPRDKITVTLGFNVVYGSVSGSRVAFVTTNIET